MPSTRDLHALGAISLPGSIPMTRTNQALFAAAVNYLRDHPEVGMVYGDCNYIDESGKVIGKFNTTQTDYRLLRQGYTHIPQQTMFFRADLWKQVGPLDPIFLLCDGLRSLDSDRGTRAK